LPVGPTPSDGDADFKAGADIQFALDFYFTFMGFGNVFADAKSQTTAPFIP
jgi:hypothetical protein